MKNDVRITLHTNFPAPYRKHQYALWMKHWQCRFVFYEQMSVDRPWSYDISDWGIDYRLFWRRFGIRRLRFSPQLVSLLFRAKRGDIHILGSAGAYLDVWILMLFAAIGRIKLVVGNDAGFPESVDEKARRTWSALSRLQFWFMRKVAYCYYTAGRLGHDYALASGFSEDKVVNTYFSHDVDAFVRYRAACYKDKRKAVRSELGIADDAVVSLNVSRYLDWKRLVDLALAFRNLEGARPDLAARAHLIVVGDGDCRDHVPMLNGLRHVKVHMIKQMPPEEVMAYYCAADLFVFPSEGDIWGLVVNEALSMGLPVICTERIGASELVSNGVNGYKVPVRRPDMIAEKLELLIEDGGTRKMLSDNAKNIARTWRTDFGVAALERYLEKNP